MHREHKSANGATPLWVSVQIDNFLSLADQSSGAALSPTAPTASKWEIELFPYSAAKCGILEM